MKKTKTTFTVLLTAVVIMLLSSACTHTSIRVGYSSTNVGKKMQAHYKTFDGIESKMQNLDAGQTMTLSYEAEVDKGTLEILVLDPQSDEVWSVTLESDDSGRFEMTSGEGGNYVIRINAYDTGGSYKVTWELS